MDIKVDAFMLSNTKWKDELLVLREILLDCGLIEQLKWRVPCYLFNGKNIVLINGFKQHCVIGFFKGSLLLDSDQLLVAQSENVQSSRILCFHSVDEILQKKELIKKYIFEAIEIEKAGLKVDFKSTDAYPVPSELQDQFKDHPELELAFNKLTPGRKRGYLLHFNAAKQAKTRLERISKCQPRILMGKGLNDCICGKSKRMPNCDGSHSKH